MLWNYTIYQNIEFLLKNSLQLVHAEQKYQRQQQQLKNTRSQGVGTTASGEYCMKT